MNTETVPIDSIYPDPANVRLHDDRNIAAIKGSLARFGQQTPLVVDGDGIIRKGNGTMLAAKSLGWTEIAVVRTALTGADAIAYAIADNRTAELAKWDGEGLAKQYEGLDEELKKLIDFKPDELGRFDVNEVGSPVLESGDRAPFRQMTFTVHDDQFEEVETAMSKAKDDGGGESAVNENSNGNALAWICERFNRG